MKVGIVTITDGQNYGNRLQNYALQTVLEGLGFDVETIGRKSFRDLGIIKKSIFLFKQVVKLCLRRPDTQFSWIKRKILFDRFNDKYIKFTPVMLHDNTFPSDISSKFDYFVCGSDQIWNARFAIVQEDIKNNFAYFAKKSQRVAYAASFGTPDVAPGYEKLFADELSNFSAIGVREKSGVDLVKLLTGRTDAMVVLDPTLLLTPDHWKEIEQKPGYINEKDDFIVAYFLGTKSELLIEQINRIANCFNSRIVYLDIEFLTDEQIIDKNMFCTSPCEFVWLMSHAKCILSDSFHASVFSVIFKKQFLIYKRIAVEQENDMYGRIESFLQLVGFQDSIDDLDNPRKFPNNVYSDNTSNIIRLERERSIGFLKSNLR